MLFILSFPLFAKRWCEFESVKLVCVSFIEKQMLTNIKMKTLNLLLCVLWFSRMNYNLK